MIGAKLHIEADCEVLSPIHVGSGEFRPPLKGEFRADSGEDGESGEIATVMKDVAGKPYIPGSTLKGVLRAEFDLAERLFGPAKIESGETPKSGILTFWNSYLKHSEDDQKARHLDDRDGSQQKVGLFVDTNISKDAEAGIVKKGLLFRKEKVLAGAVFSTAISVVDPLSEDLQQLAILLKSMCRESGLALGKGTRAGEGRVRLIEDTIKVEIRPVHADWLHSSADEFLKAFARAEPVVELEPAYMLHLACDGPFLIADPQRQRNEKEKGSPQVGALLNYDGMGPRLTGETLLGALRARYEEFVDLGHLDSKIDVPDDGWLPQTSTERLFGNTDWKGLVRIAKLKATKSPERKPITSVRIDRFSGAPVDNALFTTETWTGNGFELALAIDKRSRLSEENVKVLAQDDRNFCDFIHHLTCDIWGGLELGQGGNKGFGWFSVEVVQ